ncbi:MAG: outer membrane beta-barrel protein [Longimicrobiales bacterium]|nr:outer membrane beta-barrel protein [Longimicrobiales bacterium]
MRGPRRARAPGILLAFGIALASLASPLRAQDDPPMPELPQRFSVALGGANWIWDTSPAGTPSVGDATSINVELESLVTPWLGFRLGGGFGRPDLRTETDEVEVNQYHVEVLAVLRAPGLLDAWEITPFIDAGYGTLVHDPRRAGLVTKNQSMWLYGAGVEWDALDRVGFRASWRRTAAELNNVFDPSERDTETVDADRLIWSVFWRF